MTTLLIVATATNTVTNIAVVDDPSHYTPDSGYAVVVQTAATASVAVGWLQQADGTFKDPNAPGPPTPAQLVAYTLAARAAIVDSKMIPVTAADGVQRYIPIEIQTRSALTAGRVKVGENATYTIKSWTFKTGEVKEIGKVDIIAFGDAADDAFQHMFDQQALCLAGIANGTYTTTAQIDQVLGA